MKLSAGLWSGLVVLVFCALLAGVGTARAGGTTCAGDCNSDTQVTAAEIQQAIDVIFDAQLLGDCASLDTNSDGAVKANELLIAVINAGNMCQGPPETPTSRPPTPTFTQTVSPTPTATMVTPTSAPVDSVAGGTTVIVNSMALVPSIVGALVTGLTSTSALVTLDTDGGGGASACPLGGTATKTGNPITGQTITLTACKLATGDGSVTYDGTAIISLVTSFSVNITMVFRDQADQQTETASATLSGSVSPALGGSCYLTAATLTIANGSLSATTVDGSVGMSFSDTTVVVSNITFNTDCVPTIYTLTFNGPASLFSPSGEPKSASFTGFRIDVDDSGPSTIFTVTGMVSSTCFGGDVSLTTPAALSVPSGAICPDAGNIAVEIGQSTAQVFYRSDMSVEIDVDGDGNIDTTAPNCLDPRLLACAA